jgi:hypothetical protein
MQRNSSAGPDGSKAAGEREHSTRRVSRLCYVRPRPDDPTGPAWTRLTPRAKWLWRLIRDLDKNELGKCFASQAKQARMIGVESDRTVRRLLNELKAAGFVSWERHAHNHYKACVPPLMSGSVSGCMSGCMSGSGPPVPKRDPKQHSLQDSNTQGSGDAVAVVREAAMALIGLEIDEPVAWSMANRDAELALAVVALTSERPRDNPAGWAVAAFYHPERHFVNTGGRWQRKRSPATQGFFGWAGGSPQQSKGAVNARHIRRSQRYVE